MTSYDLVLIGESDFTGFFADIFKKELKVLAIANSNFKRDFSIRQFPSKSYIPTGVETSSVYGQVCSEYFRIDLLHNLNLTSLFFQKDLKIESALLDDLKVKSAEYFEILNNIIVENFPKGMLGLLKRPMYFLKNYSSIKRLIKSFPCPTEEFKIFMRGLTSFFAPGEANYNYYNFYLLYSLLNKNSYKMYSSRGSFKDLDIIESDRILELNYEKSNWKVIFEKKGSVTADFMISAFTPHIFHNDGIKNPFRVDYNQIFYEFLLEGIELPETMNEELVYIDKSGRDYFAIKGKSSLWVYTFYRANELPSVDLIEPFIEEFIPYVSLEKIVSIKPTTIPYYEKERLKRFREKRTFYFPKSYDFPYYGTDGEVLYRNKLRDIIWKRFLS